MARWGGLSVGTMRKAMVLYQVDAFATKPFSGNPAAVAVLDKPAPEPFMQAVASEMNLSETAFVTPAADGFGLRWFTPVSEVDLCGHATLASAHVLWETGGADSEKTLAFHTLSGRLEAWRSGDRIEMDFPAEPAEPCDTTIDLLGAVGGDIEEAGRNRLDYIVLLASEERVRQLKPDLDAVSRLGTRGLIVTARSSVSDCDFISRYFAPQFGVAEDPVTGSTHCCLGPYWAERLGRDELTGYQASARGGFVHVRTLGERVVLGGGAVSTARIELLVDG